MSPHKTASGKEKHGPAELGHLHGCSHGTDRLASTWATLLLWGSGQLESTLPKAQQEMMLRPHLGPEEGPGTGLSWGGKNSAAFLLGAGCRALGVINGMEGTGRHQARTHRISSVTCVERKIHSLPNN